MVTFAASFHWMDRPLVARTVRSMLNPGGILVHVDKWHQPHLRKDVSRSELPSVPHEEIAPETAHIVEDRDS